MQDDANDLPEVPTRAATGWRAATLLGVGGVVGLTLGVLLTVGVSATRTFLTPTLPLPATRDSMQVLTELNELRRQVNQLNEDKKVQDQGRDDAMRRALATLAAAVRERASATTGAAPSAEKPGGGMGRPPARNPTDPFAELDAEIKSLEQTQTVLNAILDLFLPAGKEPAKDRERVADPPK